jgi:hypothetical protein
MVSLITNGRLNTHSGEPVSNDSQYGREFLDNYLQVMGSTWRTEGEEAKLLANPTEYAIEKGLPVAPGAVVRLDRSQPDSLFTVDELIRDWTLTPGEHVLHVPFEELIGEADLTDAELETVAGGEAAPNINVVVACYVA